MANISTIQKPELWNFKLRANDSWPPESFELKNSAGEAIVTYTPKMQIRKTVTSTEVKKELTVGNGFVKVGSKTTFDDTMPVNLPPGEYVFDIEVTIDGRKHTPWEGKIMVDNDVTR